MPKLENPRWERFAQLCALLNNASEAYRKLGTKKAGKIIKNVDVNSDQLMSKPGVRERVAELRRENDRKATLSREQMLEWLTRVIMTGAGSVTPTDSLCQAHKVTNGDGWEAHEVKVPDKLGAAQQLARMCDWNSAERIELSMDSLTSYLVELRQQPLIGGRVLEFERPALLVESEANGEEEPPRSQ
jgi:terminase small subunit-like protein